MLNVPGVSFHQLLHYVDVHLNDKSIDAGIIHVKINDFLTVSSRSRSGMCRIFFRVVYTTRVDVSLLERVYALILDF